MLKAALLAWKLEAPKQSLANGSASALHCVLGASLKETVQHMLQGAMLCP